MTRSVAELCAVFGRIGLLSFGGPAAQIALMHKELVETRNWLTEAQFLRALSFCMLLPGPEAMQLATYAGWKQRGIIGGLIGGGLFVIPGAIVIAALAWLYVSLGNLDWVQAVFLGIKATVVVIVIEALLKVSKRALTNKKHIAIAIAAFVALFALSIPFPVVILVAAVIGVVGANKTSATNDISLNWGKSGRILFIGGLLWAAPFAPIVYFDAFFLAEIGVFFSTLAVVTFGGAYAVLAYMTQEVVTGFGWLTTGQMIDALGLAETTPGPLILVTQFVGMLAGYAQGGISMSILAGVLTLWVTFVPCFIWIFAGAPLIDWMEGRPRLSAGLAAITAAVVGVIANLSLWFALHVFFNSVTQTNLAGLSIATPDLATIQILPVGIAVVAAILMLWRKWPMLMVLPLCGLLGLIGAAV